MIFGGYLGVSGFNTSVSIEPNNIHNEKSVSLTCQPLALDGMSGKVNWEQVQLVFRSPVHSSSPKALT